MVENEGGTPGATTATSNGPSGNLSIKILLNYKDTQETNSSSQPKKKKKQKRRKKSQQALQALEGLFLLIIAPFLTRPV